MDNILRTYEKYLADGGGCGGDTSEDESSLSDTEIFDDEIDKNFNTYKLSRKSSSSSIPSNAAFDPNLLSQHGIKLDFLNKIQQQAANNEIPNDTLTRLNLMGTDEATNFLKDLWTRFEKSTAEAPDLIGRLYESKSEKKIEALKEIFEKGEQEFQRKMKLVEQTNFDDLFPVNSNIPFEQEEKLSEIKENSKKNDEMIVQYNLAKLLGSNPNAMNESN